MKMVPSKAFYYLNHVLYKCPCCGTEGKMLGKGVNLSCGACGATWMLTEYGTLEQVSLSMNSAAKARIATEELYKLNAAGKSV